MGKVSEKERSSQKIRKTGKKKKFEGGGIYISHLPHGFYEKELKEYFSQFGTVVGVRVVRSKRTGQSKGYAFVAFLHEEVAKIAAETMDNYLIYERLIQCKFIPHDQLRMKSFSRRHITPYNYPRKRNRQNSISQRNLPRTEAKAQQKSKAYSAKCKKKLDRIKELGVAYSLDGLK